MITKTHIRKKNTKFKKQPNNNKQNSTNKKRTRGTHHQNTPQKEKPVVHPRKPVDPAGPDCYRAGTKTCKSSVGATPADAADGSVTRPQPNLGTRTPSGN